MLVQREIYCGTDCFAPKSLTEMFKRLVGFPLEELEQMRIFFSSQESRDSKVLTESHGKLDQNTM